MLMRLTAALATLIISTAAAAQWVPGSEIVGQRVHVQTNGVTNLVYFQPDGTARISSPSGATVIDATWTAGNGQLCLKSGDTSDCYPYVAPFQAGQPVDLLSNCAVLSRWLAPSITVPAGERG